MATGTRRLTAEEYWRSIGKYRWSELVCGEVTQVTPANSGHGVIAGNVLHALRQYGDRRGDAAMVQVGFILQRNPDTVRGPDVAYVRAERLAGKDWDRFWPEAPDLAVEIVSPSNTRQEIEEKLRDYLQAGTRLVWVVSPASRSVNVDRPDGTTSVLRDDDVLDGEDVLPGFTLPLHDVFRLPGT